MTAGRLADDCFVHDRDRMRHQEVLDLIRERLTVVASTGTVKLSEAGGRILATDVRAPRPVPAHDNAAVDGYAFASAAGGVTLPVSLRIVAGDAPPPLPPGTAARIFTGAPMPDGADRVAMQEDAERRPGGVALPALRPGANRRRAGEDVAEGKVVASAGDVLDARALAAIASTGTERVEVRRRLRVGLVSNGDELLLPGEPFRHGAVYDSNRTMLASMVRDWGVQLVDLGLRGDDGETITATMADAAGRCDLVLTSGGASKGEEDHVRDALDSLGSRHLWQIAVKPGRPMMLGTIGQCVVAGLPGNPVAAFVCALLYLRPMLRVLGGANWVEPVRFAVPAAFSIDSKPDRREFLRGRVVGSGADARAEKFGRDGSGLISGLRWATGLIEVAEDTTEVRAGDPVSFIPFSEFGLRS